jgi:hypothetical protein
LSRLSEAKHETSGDERQPLRPAPFELWPFPTRGHGWHYNDFVVHFGKLIIVLGAVLVAVGLTFVLLGRTQLPIGRLPGDIIYRRRNFAFYFPLTTSILLSIVLSLVFYFLSRMHR